MSKNDKSATLILMRHGQSEWNLKNLFTGWVDVPLSAQGVQEAIDGGRSISDLPIDFVYTSTLIRGQMTAMLALMNHHSGKIPVIAHGDGLLQEWGQIYSPDTKKQTIPVFCSWHLNERMYGELQGLNKAETAQKYGAEQVRQWRRSYDTPPPNGESLEMTAERTIPYFRERILPHLQRGENVFIAAHGNSLRSIIMDLDGLSKEEVLNLEVPTGIPIVYSWSQEAGFKKIDRAAKLPVR